MEDLIGNIIDNTSGIHNERPAEPQEPEQVEPQSEPQAEPEKSEPENSEPEKVEPEKKEPIDFLKTHFPDVESVEQLKEQASSLKNLETENEKLKGELDKLRGSLKGLDSGVDPNYMRLQKIEKENPKIAPVYKKMMLGELESKEYLKMSLIMDDPDLGEDKEMLDMVMEDKYPILFDDDADPDSDEYKKAMKKLSYDAKKAEQRIKGEFEKIDIPQLETEDQKKEKLEKIMGTWKDFDFTNKELTTVKVSLDGEGGDFMDIEIPEAERQQYLKAAMQYMIDNGLEKSKDSAETIQQLITSAWIGGNLSKYNRMVAEKSKQMSDRDWRKFIHNPKPEKETASQPSTPDGIENLLNQLD